MSELDWVVIGLYFAVIGLLAWWYGRDQQDSVDYFLAGRNAGFIAVGASIFTSNIGSEHIVGLAGQGTSTGMAMAHWELHAWILILLAGFFVPFYYKAGVQTIPEFLERRFNSQARSILSVVSLVAYVFTKVSVTVYAGAIVFQALLPDTFGSPENAFWVGAFTTVILTGIYTVFGGMRAIMATATPQAVIILFGSLVITALGLSKLSDGGGVIAGWGELVATVRVNSDNFALWRPLSDPDFPWLGVLIASPIVGIWYWCTDQYIVQRALSARDLTTARRGALFGGLLKVWPVLIFLIPGLIGWALHQKGLIALPMHTVNGVETINGDTVFPTLVSTLLPSGIRGLIVACLLAALMSSLASLFNSSASLFTVDIYEKLRPGKSESHLLNVGRIATTVVVILGLLWIPVMKTIAGGGLYVYLQSVQGYLAPPITAVFLLGLFWKRLNATGRSLGAGRRLRARHGEAQLPGLFRRRQARESGVPGRDRRFQFPVRDRCAVPVRLRADDRGIARDGAAAGREGARSHLSFDPRTARRRDPRQLGCRQQDPRDADPGPRRRHVPVLQLLAELGVALRIPTAAYLLATVGAFVWQPAWSELKAFDFDDVELLDGPFLDASMRNAQYLLSLEPDRLLHNTRKYAGLQPKAPLYDGWESAGIAGHTLGHYLTALSQQFASTGDRRFRERIDYIVAEMADAQSAYGDGYVGALPPRELSTLRKLKNGVVEVDNPFNFSGGVWVPWYTQHKILAGLRDAWVTGGNTQAREVALGLADWIDDVTAPLDSVQLQRMLEVEHGGMREVLIDLYELTKEVRYLDVAERFRHDAVLEPLAAGRDELPGKHANTQIPKITGTARNFEVTGDSESRQIAEYFWHQVVDRHSWVIGGNSEGEHFFEPRESPKHLTAATAESCNTYNMLKLTDHLFRWESRVEYADYYERALYNHILASQEPETGMFAYFISLRPGFFRTYSTPFESFWCCVGTGMENHSKYGRAIYFHDEDSLFINLFIASRLTWRDQGLILEQRTDYPDNGRIRMQVLEAPVAPLTIRVRVPLWASGDIEIQVNSEQASIDGKPGRYAALRRQWRAGDQLDFRIPMSLRVERLHGSENQVAFLYGPTVLAGDLGPVARTGSFPYARDQWDNFEAQAAPVPTIIGDPANIAAMAKRTAEDVSEFQIMGTLGGRDVVVRLRPFSDLHFEHSNVYWTVVTAEQ